eukprot:6478934-Amphidinium_carterae.1
MEWPGSAGPTSLQQQNQELWQHYQNSPDRARGASSRAQTQGRLSHKRRKGDYGDKPRSKSQHWRAWNDEPAQPPKGKGRRERERQRETAAYGRPQNEATA